MPIFGLSERQARWVPILILIFAAAIVPVYYETTFVSSFGWNASPYIEPPPGFATIFLLQPNVTARIWVSYTALGNTGFMETGGDVFTAQGASEATGFEVQANPSSISKAEPAKQMVIYTITSPKEAQGFYRLWVTQICPGIPMAVGVSVFQLNQFPGLGGVYSCYAILFFHRILAYSGMAEFFVAG